MFISLQYAKLPIASVQRPRIGTSKKIFSEQPPVIGQKHRYTIGYKQQKPFGKVSDGNRSYIRSGNKRSEPVRFFACFLHIPVGAYRIRPLIAYAR